MRGIVLAAICTAATLVPAAHAQDGAPAPVTLSGRCETDVPLTAMLRNRDDARDVAVPSCNRAMIEPGARVRFFRGDRQVLAFRGHPGEETDITMDAVTIGESGEFDTSKGRCRFYQTPDGIMIVCFAVYRKNGANYGAVAMFEAD